MSNFFHLSILSYFLSGPPFMVPNEQVQSLFGEFSYRWWAESGEWVLLIKVTVSNVDGIVGSLIPGASCDIELLQSVDALTDRYKSWGLDSLTETVHLISPKTKWGLTMVWVSFDFRPGWNGDVDFMCTCWGLLMQLLHSFAQHEIGMSEGSIIPLSVMSGTE